MVLLNANGLGTGPHRSLHAVRARAGRKKHLAKAQDDSGLMGQAIMCSHAVHSQ